MHDFDTGKTILITGSTGFIGNRLCENINKKGGVVRRALRRTNMTDDCLVGDFGPKTNFMHCLKDVDCIVHLAARVHVMRDIAVAPLEEFRRVNVDGTLNLANQAVVAGVKRFIYISSIKVNGEKTDLNMPFSPDDIPAPIDLYAISKYEAEEGLRRLAEDSNMEVVIIRPPLVYGPGVKANFLNMMRWMDRGIPLPFGAIHNKRSLVALDNLVDLIITCIFHPAAANQIFLVSDGDDLSTTELLQRTAVALGKPARLLPVPHRFLELSLKMLGKQDLGQRLCDSLQVDIADTRNLLDWNPPLTVNEGLRRTVQSYKQNKNN